MIRRKWSWLLIILVLSISVIPIIFAATILVEEGFEGGDRGTWDAEHTSVNGTISYTNTTAKQGTYSLLANTTSDNQAARIYEDISAGYATIYSRVYFNLPVLPSSGNYTQIYFIEDDNLDDITEVAIYNDAGTYKIRVRLPQEPSVQYSGAIVIVADTWYRLEVKVFTHNTAGTVDIWYDTAVQGSPTYSLSAKDTMGSGTEVGRVSTGICWSRTNGHAIYIDSTKISDGYIGSISSGPVPEVSKVNNVEDFIKVNEMNISDLYKINGLVFPVTNQTTGIGGAYVVGNEIHYQDQGAIQLAGGAWGIVAYSVSESLVYANVNEGMVSTLSGEGANYVVIALNSELWENDPDQADYRDRIDEIVGWCNNYSMFYQFKLQQVGEGPLNNNYPAGTFCQAGSNWKLTDPAATTNGYSSVPFNTRSKAMWTDLATLYGDDDNLIGYHLLNEPYGLSDYTKWENVITYYEECIVIIEAIDPDAIFFVMPPNRWGSYLGEWTAAGNPYAGYLDNDQVVYEYHSYYWNTASWPGGWGYAYTLGYNEQGYANNLAWHETNVKPTMDAGHPTFCGEFGVHGAYTLGEPPTIRVGYDYGVPDQITIMNDLGIHYTMFYMKGAISGQAWGMFNNGGNGLCERGDILVDNIPGGLLKP